MVETVKLFLRDHHIDLNGTKVCVATSTGVDSSVLTFVLNQLRQELHFQLILCHVNHKIRPEADIEEEYLKKYAAKANLGLEIYRFKKEEIPLHDFEARARLQRMAFFKKVMDKYNAKYLFLAHHLNDDIETSLMRFIKGSSASGYYGIKAVSKIGKDKYLLRPFLKVLKSDILKYAKAQQIVFFEDQTNASDKYTRNRIRRDIVPLLFRENPQFARAYLHYKDTIKTASDIICRVRDDFIARCVFPCEEGVCFSALNFLTLQPFMQKEVLFYLLKESLPGLQFVNAVVKMIALNKANAEARNRLFTIYKAYGNVYLVKTDNKMPENAVLIDHVGTYDIGNRLLEVRNFPAVEAIKNKNFLTNLNRVWYNNNKLPLILRHRKNGDKIKIAGGEKKIKDLLIDAKVPRFQRDKLYLLEKDGEVLCVFGVRKSSRLDFDLKNNILLELKEKKVNKLTDINQDVAEILYSKAEIVRKCREIGAQISRDYAGKNLLMIGLLKGATPYFMELIKYITVNPELDFLRASSYIGTASSGKIAITCLDAACIKDKDILIVEDIVDTGYTLSEVVKYMQQSGARSVAITALLDKPETRKYDVAIKYVGFTIPNKFVVGFGLDYNQKYRSLPYIGVLKPEIYTKSKEDS